ncbi:MAG TPA: peptide chain release factor N(5)-glutamine methyltransferase [Tepidiformaceae bacterium]|nr:peptide chain release factor N(5)-glutamine methyltransferase [Tepidiformaceae bacterium]
MNARAAAARVRSQLTEAGVPDAAFEAELLVREAGGLSRTAFFVGASLDCAAQHLLSQLAERRAAREPWAHLSGTREFCGLAFAVGPGVLIPRPETETVVEIVLDELRRAPGAVVVDAGTGSGCIATAIAANAPQARVITIEASQAALPLAQRNFAAHGVPVALVRGDLAASVSSADIVVANLPYIPTSTIASLEPEVRDWEPRLALDGGPDGLDLIRRLIEDCAVRLRPQLLALEVMSGQAGEVSRFAEARGARTSRLRDLAGIERVVTARWA